MIRWLVSRILRLGWLGSQIGWSVNNKWLTSIESQNFTLTESVGILNC